jgi:putative transposase
VLTKEQSAQKELHSPRFLNWRSFKTQVGARLAIFDFIEGRYTPHRRHSALDYLSPINYERSCSTAARTSPIPSTESG